MAKVQDQKAIQIMDEEVQRVLNSYETAVLKISKDKPKAVLRSSGRQILYRKKRTEVEAFEVSFLFLIFFFTWQVSLGLKELCHGF